MAGRQVMEGAVLVERLQSPLFYGNDGSAVGGEEGVRAASELGERAIESFHGNAGTADGSGVLRMASHPDRTYSERREEEQSVRRAAEAYGALEGVPRPVCRGFEKGLPRAHDRAEKG